MYRYCLLILSCLFGMAPVLTTAQVADTSTTPGQILLKQGTIVTLKLEEELRSDEVEETSIIPLTVGLDVVVDGQRLALTGAYAEARVKKARRAKAFGKPGELEIEPINMQLIDGQRIPLYGKARGAKGKNRKFLAWVVAIVTPGVGAAFAASAGSSDAIPFMIPFAGLGFLVKGKEAVMPVGAIVTANVTRDVWVRIE